MGRSKRLNAWKGSTKGERQVDRDSRNGLGVKQSGRLVYDDDARGRAQNNWLHWVLFVVIAVVVENAECASEVRARCDAVASMA
jgi:hypothetical protein